MKKDKMQQKLEELKKQRTALNRLIREYENRETYFGDHEMFRIKLKEDSDSKTSWYELAIKVPSFRLSWTTAEMEKHASYRYVFSALTKKEILDFVNDMHLDVHKLHDDLEADVRYLESTDSEEGSNGQDD